MNLALNPPTTIAAALAAATPALTAAGVDTPRLDAQLLLASAIDGRREDLLMSPERVLTPGELAAFNSLVERRAARCPLPYLTGTQWFYGLEFNVTDAVLIPRPETEMLVDFALAHASPGSRIADIGTGSGCIAVSIAAVRPDATVAAVDLSPDALAVAASNAVRHSVESRVTLLAGDLLAPLAGLRFDIIVSNPPYIPLYDMPALMPEVRDHEPALALHIGAGDDGLAIYRRLFADSPALLAPHGRIAVEVGQGQADDVRAIAVAAGFDDITVANDGAGIGRVVSAIWRGNRSQIA
ncbi:MAG TPA: peptide chain release factor N(5)-glutamine methyltransferase [Capsulimonadaceae bacterium]